MTSEASEISLARREAFSIGRLFVDPAAREVSIGEERAMLEPRVMQVLIALADEHGSVVARDTLIARCWSGRAVSEDALNRTIAKVRQIASGVGRGSFLVDTVTKVGYRLRLERPSDLGLANLDPIGRLGQLNVSTVGTREAMPLVPAVRDLETRGLSLLFQATAEQTADGVNYLRQATAASPDRAELWGSLAMGYVLSLPFSDPGSMPQVAQRADEAAQRALALDPHDGRAIAAQISLRPTYGHWAEKDEQLQRGLALAVPETPPLMFQHVQFLASVGRTSEALALAERLSAISPLVPWIQSALANLLAAEGRLDDAQQAAEAAAQIWPRDRLTWFTKFNLALYGGRPRDALAMAEARSQWPEGSTLKIELLQTTATALIDGATVAANRVMDELAERARDDRSLAETGVQVAALFGQSDRAFALARQMYGAPGRLSGRGEVMPRVGFDDGNERNSALLFLPPVSGLRTEAEFLTLVREIGLVHYWRMAGPPSFFAGISQWPSND